LVVRAPERGYAEANRDPPREVEVERNLRRRVAFGGTHHCVGAPLARAEWAIAFEILLERLPGWTIADDLGGEAFERSSLLRSRRRLWLRW
jgi:cytochrome P450